MRAGPSTGSRPPSWVPIPRSRSGLAYAITIHKSQGLTFDACCVHTKVFAEGQLYVGLSRVRSAAGLTVFPKIEPNRLIASREVVEFYDSLEHRMEEPVQIECPRRYEVAGPRLHPRPHGRQGTPTPHASRPGRLLENSKGRYPGTGDRRPARTLEEKIRADIVTRATFALKDALSGAMSKDHLDAKMLLAGYVLDGTAAHMSSMSSARRRLSRQRIGTGHPALRD